jgi:signal peptidase II
MNKNSYLFPTTCFSIIILDQVTKQWIRSNLAIGESLWEWGIFRIIRIPPNTGAAFGLFRNFQPFLAVFSALSSIAILGAALYLWRRYPSLNTYLIQFMLGLLLGGTIGNMIDRMQPELGGVTDFISVSVWPSFNIADASIVVSLLFFAYYLFRLARENKI